MTRLSWTRTGTSNNCATKEFVAGHRTLTAIIEDTETEGGVAVLNLLIRDVSSDLIIHNREQYVLSKAKKLAKELLALEGVVFAQEVRTGDSLLSGIGTDHLLIEDDGTELATPEHTGQYENYN